MHFLKILFLLIGLFFSLAPNQGGGGSKSQITEKLAPTSKKTEREETELKEQWKSEHDKIEPPPIKLKRLLSLNRAEEDSVDFVEKSICQAATSQLGEAELLACLKKCPLVPYSGDCSMQSMYLMRFFNEQDAYTFYRKANKEGYFTNRVVEINKWLLDEKRLLTNKTPAQTVTQHRYQLKRKMKSTESERGGIPRFLMLNYLNHINQGKQFFYFRRISFEELDLITPEKMILASFQGKFLGHQAGFAKIKNQIYYVDLQQMKVTKEKESMTIEGGSIMDLSIDILSFSKTQIQTNIAKKEPQIIQHIIKKGSDQFTSLSPKWGTLSPKEKGNKIKRLTRKIKEDASLAKYLKIGEADEKKFGYDEKHKIFFIGDYLFYIKKEKTLSIELFSHMLLERGDNNELNVREISLKQEIIGMGSLSIQIGMVAILERIGALKQKIR